MKKHQDFAYLLVLLLLAALLNVVGGADGTINSFRAAVFLASILLLIIIGLICSDFLVKIDWLELYAYERIKSKENELHHGRRHLLREIHKQLSVLKQMSEQHHKYHDELLKELAVLTRQLES